MRHPMENEMPAATTPARPIVLHVFALSGHCYRVELFLRLLKLPTQVIQVDLMAGEQRKPEFLALNRFAQVPVIDDDGTVVADSNAILTYLALRYAPDSSWLPREPVAAARVQRWLALAAGPLARSAAVARAAKVFKRDIDTSAQIKEAEALFARMDAEIRAVGTPWLAGGQPTIADLAMYAYTAHAPEGNIPLEPYPAIRAWIARVEALPGFVGMPVSAVGLRAAS